MSTIVVDSSALLAILLEEPEAERMMAAMLDAGRPVIGAATLVEAAAALTARRGPAAGVALDALIQALDIEIVPMDADAATFARDAWIRFGKVLGKPAVLDFGDCLSWGTAAALGAPLLFKGEDFRVAGVQAVSW